MGAVNYSCSDYITMGIKPYGLESFTDETGNIDYEEMYSCYKDDRENADSIIEKYGFYYFHVATKPGYYEGFSVDIEFNFPAFFDNCEERAEAQKEVTALKKCLVELAGIGLVSCRPGWVTGYDDYSGTLQQIKAAVKAMRADVAETPTFRQYCA